VCVSAYVCAVLVLRERLRRYGVATVSRIDKIIGLFCRISSLLLASFAKETYNLIDPTNCSHPVCCVVCVVCCLLCVVYVWCAGLSVHLG